MSAFNSLVEVYEIFNDKDGAVKTMKELMEGYPDTKISEEAKRRLKHIEKWEF
jgi:outer membrane protein assembly factor BamD (BamD/ComL family)